MGKEKISKKRKNVIIIIIVVLAVIAVIAGICIKNHNDYLNSLTAYDVINGPGDFQLEGEQVFVLDEVKEIFEDCKLGTHISKITEKYGEPDRKEEGALLSNYYYDLLDGAMLLNVAINNYTEEIDERFMIIESSMWMNIKLSSELESDIEDLVSIMKNVKEGMTFEEVVGILGDKYLQTGENEKYSVYAWLDVNENRTTITIDNEIGKVSRIERVFAQQ